jgi:uncharacterized protein
MPALRLTLEPGGLTVCRLPADDAIPGWAATAAAFVSITRTADELSIVCAEGLPPAGTRQEPGWRAFKVAGPLDFGLTGILASLLTPLARAGISVFVVNTYDTDYVLVQAARVVEAAAAWRAAGHTVNLS